MALTIALVGNPNCGKTTLFNALTGSHQYVGNWPGVTVEKKEGWLKEQRGGEHVRVMDLPGIYSLTPYSNEEVVTRDYIIAEHPDVIVSIVDGTNLERNLYLTLQAMELGSPVVVAINMMDMVKARGDIIDCAKLSRFLGVDTLPVSARSGEGVDALVKSAIAAAHKKAAPNTHGLYDRATEAMEDRVLTFVMPHAQAARVPARWAALKLLEGDTLVRERLNLHAEDAAELDALLEEFVQGSRLKDIDMILADQRYAFITRICSQCVTKAEVTQLTTSQRIDKVMTHRVAALPVFFGLMALMFFLTFGPAGNALRDGASALIQLGIDAAGSGLAAIGAPIWLQSLVVDGALTGVGGILGFLPQIAILFLCLSLLEDTGYMARVAFIMDRAMRRLGLSGKSFIPMLMGFGCTTPAVMGARTMENENNRRMTILLTPFMSCGAKLPVYALFAGAFFAANQSLVVVSMYLLGVLVAVASGLILGRTVFKGEQAPFVMELPAYRLPTLRGTWTHLWERIKGFLIKAGSVILAMSIVIWFLQSFNFSFQLVTDNSTSILADVGRFIAPAFLPLGFGNWQSSVSLLSGLVAKEAVVSTGQVVFGFADAAHATTALSAYFTPLAAYAFMAFVLLYPPCVAAFATIKREMNSWKWALGCAAWQIAVAYVVSMLIFQIGSIFV